MSDKNDQIEARRALVTQMLSLAGAGALLSSVAGCDSRRGGLGSDERFGESSDSIVPDTIETIFGSAGLNNYAPPSPTVPIFALGYYYKGDGGGGLFYWDGGYTGTPVPGMRIRPPSQTQGAWIRVYDGALNVKWFGAVPNTSTIDCSDGIEAAILFSIEVPQPAGGGTNTVYFPMGEYKITRTIVIPRLAAGAPVPNFGPVTIRGEGREKSMIVANAGALEPDEPVMGFDTTENHSHSFSLEGLSLKRSDAGRVFDFRPTTGWGGEVVTNRLTFARFRNLFLYAHSNPNADDWSDEACLYIEGGQSCRFEDVICQGGRVAFHLNMSSLCSLYDCVLSPQDRSSANGLFITGGGSHMIHRMYIGDVGSSTQLGTAILIDDSEVEGQPPTQHVVFEAINGEGGNTAPFLHVASGVNITAIDLHAPYTFATSAHNGSNLVHIGPGARHVRFIAGSIDNAYSYITTTSKSIRVDAGAKDIFFDDVRVGDADFDQNLAVHADAKRVELNLVHGTIGGTQDLWSKDRRTFGMDDPPTLSTADYQPSVLGSNVWKVASSHNIGNLLGGYAGQTVILLIPPGSQIVADYGFQLTGNASFSPTHHSTMQFVFDGTTWRELSRSESGAS